MTTIQLARNRQSNQLIKQQWPNRIRLLIRLVPLLQWVKESKTYKLTTPIKLRTGASTSASVIVTLPAGSTIKTDQAIIQNGYRWVRQPRGNDYAYIATGPASDPLAYVKGGVAHTYYTVQSGDSWWVIAQRNGMSMTTLASQNGKSIYSTIYPGQTLQLN